MERNSYIDMTVKPSAKIGVKSLILGALVVIVWIIYLKKSKRKFNFVILGAGEKIPENKWFQKENWKNKSFVRYSGNWSSNWKYASEYPGESDVKVAGISRENRSSDFIKLAQSEDFKMYLEDDPTNPVNKNARKVMVSATVDGELVTKHIGYLPDEIANKYAGVELNISPKSVFLPTRKNLNIGVEVTLLQRSARYLKKKAKKEEIA
jgi:hypothetical protein